MFRKALFIPLEMTPCGWRLTERGNWRVSGDVLTGESFVEANEGQATTGQVWGRLGGR